MTVYHNVFRKQLMFLAEYSVFGARSRTRTGMALRAREFKSLHRMLHIVADGNAAVRNAATTCSPQLGGLRGDVLYRRGTENQN
jgi:hypothetical protein